MSVSCETFAQPTLWAPMPDQPGFALETCHPTGLDGRGALRNAGDAAPLAALVEGELAERFISWRGASGRRYVFSVYPAAECPAYCRAVLLAVARGDRGRRRVLAAFDTGIFPEPVLSRATGVLTGNPARRELHLHLLADDDDDRRAVLDDLVPEPNYPR